MAEIDKLVSFGCNVKIFISWSGERSRRLAEALKEIIPFIVPVAEAYVSSSDIDKGSRWAVDIAKELQDSSFGILCLTKENQNAPWILFEAGALGKSMDKARVVPVLLDLKKSEIDGPLLQFQAADFSEEEIRKVVSAINESCGDMKGSSERIFRSFQKWWPDLKTRYDEIMASTTGSVGDDLIDKEAADDSKILEEILELTRNQFKILRSPQEILPSSYLAEIVERVNSETIELISRRLLITPTPLDHPAWLDLRRCISDIEEVIGGLDHTEMNTDGRRHVDGLKEIHMRLRRVANFLLHRAESGVRLSTTSRATLRESLRP